MKSNKQIKEYSLTASAVDECSAFIREYLTCVKMDRRDISRCALTVEEILLNSLNVLGEGTSVCITTGKRFLHPFFSLEIGGKACNVFLNQNDSQSFYESDLLHRLGITPEYAYIGNKNLYTFRIPKKTMHPFVKLLIAVIAAAAIGAGGFLLSAGVRESLLNGVLIPLHDAFLNILSCIAGPMVFLSVAWGIYGMGDAATLKQVGKRLLSGNIITVFLLTVVVSVASVPLFSLRFSGGLGWKSEMTAIFNIILGIFPKNIFSPFVEGNTLQIIFLAVVIGIAMLFLGQKTNAVAKAVEQINNIIQFLIEVVSRLVPYFVFIQLVEKIWSDSINVFLGVIKLFAVFIAAALLTTVAILIYTSLKNHVSPFRLFHYGFPTWLVAFTTASSAAAFGTNTEICQNRLGISPKIVSFGIPMGMVTFKPTTALSYAIMTLYFAEKYGITLSVSWLAVMIFFAATLALSTPPIPGGAMTAYTVLFAQLGIPPEAIAIALTCDTLLDFITTGGDQFFLQFALLNQASSIGMVDQSILKKKD